MPFHIHKMDTEKQKIINRIRWLSDKHHKLSLLFYELSKSMSLEIDIHASRKQIKEYLKNLDLDIDKIKALSSSLTDLQLSDLKKQKGGLIK